MKKHNYPKTRKPRTTEYAKSTQLIKALGTDYLKEVFSRVGMYLAAYEISEKLGMPVSPYVVRYTRNKIGRM